MDSEYEAKRKAQNREAQRRYRQRQKTRSSQSNSSDASIASPPSGTSTIDPQLFSDSTLDALFTAGVYGTDSAQQRSISGTDDYNDGDSAFELCNDSSVSAFFSLGDADYRQLYDAVEPEDTILTAAPTPAAGREKQKDTKHDHRHSHRTSSRPLPTSHAKLQDKVEGLVDDLSRTYEFGVEMQLMSPDGELHRSISSMKGLFHRSIRRASDVTDHNL